MIHANLHSTGEHEVDIFGSAVPEDSQGVTAQLAFGFDHRYRCGVEVWGSNGRLCTNRLFTAPPGFEPEIQLESGFEKTVLKLEADDHFKNICVLVP